MLYYAVIDTNVLVSALLSSHEDAATVQVIGKLFSGEVIPLYNGDILNEYNKVLRRNKFHFSEAIVSALIQTIEKYGESVEATPSGEIFTDKKDLPFYEVVLGKQDEDTYLVTGNKKHFPKRAFIVTAREFLEILNQK